jgi:hypothetical protein
MALAAQALLLSRDQDQVGGIVPVISHHHPDDLPSSLSLLSHSSLLHINGFANFAQHSTPVQRL